MRPQLKETGIKAGMPIFRNKKLNILVFFYCDHPSHITVPFS